MSFWLPASPWRQRATSSFRLIILDVMMDTATEAFQTSLKLRDRSPDAEFAAYRETPIYA